MTKIYSFFILLTLLSCSVKEKNAKPNLFYELQKLSLSTVLVINSGSIDEYPVWSPEMDFIAVNLEGKWFKIELTNIDLIEGEWHGDRIGVIKKTNIRDLNESDLRLWRRKKNYNTRKVKTTAGDEIELKLTDFSTSLIMKIGSSFPKTLWTTGMENCHSLSVSPDEKFIAYICELNGLFITRIKQ